MPRTVTSADGTVIAFDQLGAGPPVIMVGAAFNDRSGTASLTEALAAHYTVVNYDRRGRGESGDTAPYAVEREIEDLDARPRRDAGGPRRWSGMSSGACLALEAARDEGWRSTGSQIWEAPLIVDDSRPADPRRLPGPNSPTSSPPIAAATPSSCS